MNDLSGNKALNIKYYEVKTGKIKEFSLLEVSKEVPTGFVLVSQIEGKLAKVLRRWNKY